ncbi:MAG: glycosyltransferase family 2 protein [Cyanobacteria bacterium P01_H01_bin.130]
MTSRSASSLSVILTTYQCTRRDRGVEIFQRTLDSLTVALQTFQQAFPQVALDGVIVDDGSTDETVAIAKTWLASLNGNSRWQILVQPENKGQAAARNCGAKATQGEILCFCDDDDIYFPEHFQLIYEGFQTALPLAPPFLINLPGDRPAIVTTGMRFSDRLHPDWHHALEGTMVQNRGIRRSLHEFIGGFPEDECFRIGGEDLAYVRWADTFGRRHHMATETLEYCRYPGSHFDQQLEKFQQPPDLEQLSNQVRQSPESLTEHQTRMDAYTQHHQHLMETFQRQWLSTMNPSEMNPSD